MFRISFDSYISSMESLRRALRSLYLALCCNNIIIIIICLVYRYGTGTLTKVFVDRVFQECLTYEGEVVCVFDEINYYARLPRPLN